MERTVFPASASVSPVRAFARVCGLIASSTRSAAAASSKQPVIAHSAGRFGEVRRRDRIYIVGQKLGGSEQAGLDQPSGDGGRHFTGADQ